MLCVNFNLNQWKRLMILHAWKSIPVPLKTVVKQSLYSYLSQDNFHVKQSSIFIKRMLLLFFLQKSQYANCGAWLGTFMLNGKQIYERFLKSHFLLSFSLLYLESDSLSVAYHIEINFRIWIRCKVSVMSQFLISFLFLCWITSGHTIHQPTERLLPPTVIESTSFRDAASNVAGS